MLGLLNTVLSKGNTLLTYVKDGLVMANRFLTPPKLTFPVDASAEFNGTSDYIDTGAQLISTNHTISGWIYIDNTTTALIVDQRDADNDGVYILNVTAGNIYYKINTTTLVSTKTFANQWVYFSGSYDGSTMKMYLDGSLNVSSSTSQTLNTSINTFLGRASYQSTNHFKGNLANVAIWNRALSSDEINSVMWKSYEGLTGAESNGLQAWYSLDDITSPAASLANMEQLATDKDATIENKAAITAAINALS